MNIPERESKLLWLVQTINYFNYLNFGYCHFLNVLSLFTKYINTFMQYNRKITFDENKTTNIMYVESIFIDYYFFNIESIHIVFDITINT